MQLGSTDQEMADLSEAERRRQEMINKQKQYFEMQVSKFKRQQIMVETESTFHECLP